MIESLRHLLIENPVGLLFSILALGYAIGKFNVRGFELGPVTGVLFAGLIAGNRGYELGPQVQTFGFVLFIFSVGFQAGPGFFSMLRREGPRYFVLSLFIAGSGFALAAAFASWLEFPAGTGAGLLAGAMTTTPTLAAAQDAINSGVVALPDGVTAEIAVRNVMSAYAITYLFGLVGLILIIRGAPAMLGIDLPAEAAKISVGDVRPAPGERISVRAYRVENPDVTGVPRRELRGQVVTDATLAKLRRDGEMLEIDDELTFQLGDEIVVVGRLDSFINAPRLVGPELTDPELLDLESESVKIVVTNKNAAGVTLGELGIAENYSCLATGIARSQVDVPLEAATVLERGDVLDVTGPAANIERLGGRLGHVERPLIETDLLTFAIGVALGIVLGTFSVTIGKVSVGLGTAGGLLTTGLVIGYLRSVRPTFGRMPAAARWVFMELGLVMFMAGVGVAAGEGIIETLRSVGPSLALCGIVVTAVPVAVGWVVGRSVLGLNPAVLLGAITGAMTSGAALAIVNDAAKSSAPALGYTGAYAFANVLLTVAGTLIVRL